MMIMAKVGDRVRFRDSVAGDVSGVVEEETRERTYYSGRWGTVVMSDDGTRYTHFSDLDGPFEFFDSEAQPEQPPAKRVEELYADELITREHRGGASSTAPSAAASIAAECDALKAMLLEKNEAYGNSVFEPVGIFSKLPVRERLLVRIEDKLSRLRAGAEFPGDDTIKDLIGYLVLYRIAARQS